MDEAFFSFLNAIFRRQPRWQSAIEQQARTERVPPPQEPSSWMLWLVRLTLHYVALGVEREDWRAFELASTLAGALNLLGNRGYVLPDTKWPSLQTFSVPEREDGSLAPKPMSLHQGLTTLDRLIEEYSLAVHAAFRADAEGLPQPRTPAQWVSWLINDSLVMLHNGLHGDNLPRNGWENDNFCQWASDELRVVAQLYRSGIRPDPEVPTFP